MASVEFSLVDRFRQRLHEVAQKFALCISVASCNRAFDATFHMSLQNFRFHLRQRCTRCLDLGDHIHTVTIFFQHFLYATHLPFNTAKAGKQCGWVFMRMGHETYVGLKAPRFKGVFLLRT